MRVMIPGVRDEGNSRNEKVARKILAEGKPLYVTNESEPRQVIFISYADEGGETRSKNFPDSFLPVCITEQISHEVLMKSNDFWAYVRAGALVPVPPKKAKSVLSSQDASEEVERLKMRQGKSATKIGRTISGFKNLPSGKIGADSKHPDDASSSEDMPEPELNKKMMHVMARLRVDSGTNTRTALAEIKSLKGLTNEDLGYLVGNGTVVDLDNDRSDSSITDWAMEKLSSGFKSK